MQESFSTTTSKPHFLLKTLGIFKYLIGIKKTTQKTLKELSEALTFNNATKAQRLLEQYIQQHTLEEIRLFCNSGTHGFTLLEQSLASDFYEISLMLLENGADPNRAYHKNNWYIRHHLTVPIISGDISNARLLCLFGAQLIDVTVNSRSPLPVLQRQRQTMDYISRELMPLGTLHQEQMRLAIEAEQQRDRERAAAAYQQVARLWQKVSQEETLPELKQLYYQRYEWFTRKVEELQPSPEIPEPNTLPMNRRLRHRGELPESQQPLLGEDPHQVTYSAKHK